MTVQPGDHPFGLRCWGSTADQAPAIEATSRDRAALGARARQLIDSGAYARIDLLAWNIELNDWVRMERLEAG